MAEGTSLENLVLEKSPTGIEGLDEITLGGLPCGRPTLVCGGPGCGKTMLAIEYLIRGATQFDEPGVFVTFEETEEELVRNVASLGFNLQQLIEEKKVCVEHIVVERSEIQETGEYDLEALFIRLGLAIDSIGAQRIALDTLEALFSSLPNEFILRAELRRLFRWLKDRHMTAIITAERGEKSLTRYGMEEYISDCVILLDHRVDDQVSIRRLRIVKYRGSAHGTNEFPFLIGDEGIVVLPITSIGLDHPVSNEHISTGVAGLDAMFDGGGPYRGTSILISGTSGTGKTSLAGHFANASGSRGERCLYFAFEESPQQIMRNLRSIGLNLEQWVDQGLLKFHAMRPTQYGLEMHLASIYYQVKQFSPRLVIVDPISNLTSIGSVKEVKATIMRLVDFLKIHQITGVFTNLTSGDTLEETEIGISSVIDTWLLLRDIELNGERNRGMYVLKSRGMSHSNQIREFLLTADGIHLVNAYLGPAGVLTGSARQSQEAREREDSYLRQQEIEKLQSDLERRRAMMQNQITATQAAFETEAAELEQRLAQLRQQQNRVLTDRSDMARSRRSDSVD